MSKLKPIETVANDMSGNKTERYEVYTLEQFEALLRKSNVARMHGRLDGRVSGDDLGYYPGYWSGTIRMRKSDALYFAKDAFNSTNSKDCYLRVSLVYYAQQGAAKRHVTLWIG